MFATRSTEGNYTLAAWTIQSSFWNLETAVGTRAQRFCWVLLLNRLTSNLLNLSLKLWRNFINILRSNKDTRPLVSLLFKISLGALTNCGGHDVDHIIGELAYVLTYSNQQTCCSQMVVHLH